MANFGILIHGGAGSMIKSSVKISKALKDSASLGYALLEAGQGAVDAVELAVANMEDSGLFNAGVGSCLTVDKRIEMDASIMNGKDLSCGSVGMARNIRNPVKLARLVMEKTDHVFLVADGAMELAKRCQVAPEPLEPDLQRRRTFDRHYRQMETELKKNYKLFSDNFGTVGAVAIDRHGNVASSVSTGGLWLKMPGRIGDSAVVGAGLYADNQSGAACATGHGEYMIRLCLCKSACDCMKEKDAMQSGNMAIEILTERFGQDTGRLITVDSKGRFGASANTKSMPIAVQSSVSEKTRVAFSPKEYRKLFA
jgi:beta-aspartyl-peptidase (threonine type)